MGIAVDSGGSAYITGYTQAPDFPVRDENAYLATARGAADTYSGCPPTAFVTKLSADGQSRAYSTFRGGSVEATPQVSGVLNVDGAKLIAPASWTAIYGTDRSTTTTDWTGDITPAGDLPTQLAGTSVTVNGKSAYVYAVSPMQINAIAADGLGRVTPPAPAGIVTQAVGSVQTPVTVFFGTVAQIAVATALTIGLEVNGVVGSTGLLTVAPH